MTEFNGIEEPEFQSREYFSPHMENVLENLSEPRTLKVLYKMCRLDGIPESSVRRILGTFKSEKIVKKENGLWKKV